MHAAEESCFEHVVRVRGNLGFSDAKGHCSVRGCMKRDPEGRE